MIFFIKQNNESYYCNLKCYPTDDYQTVKSYTLTQLDDLIYDDHTISVVFLIDIKYRIRFTRLILNIAPALLTLNHTNRIGMNCRTFINNLHKPYLPDLREKLRKGEELPKTFGFEIGWDIMGNVYPDQPNKSILFTILGHALLALTKNTYKPSITYEPQDLSDKAWIERYFRTLSMPPWDNPDDKELFLKHKHLLMKHLQITKSPTPHGGRPRLLPEERKIRYQKKLENQRFKRQLKQLNSISGK